MKRKCKDVDIINIEFIEKAVKDCLKNKKKTRSDIVNIFNKYGNIHNIAVQLQKEILDRKLELYPIMEYLNIQIAIFFVINTMYINCSK